MKMTIRKPSAAEEASIEERIRNQAYSQEVSYAKKRGTNNAVVDGFDFNGDDQADTLKIDGKGWGNVLLFKFDDGTKIHAKGLKYDASTKIYVDDFDKDGDQDLYVKNDSQIYVLENKAIELKDLNDVFSYIDADHSYGPSVEETCFIKSNNHKYEYRVDQVGSGGYLLVPKTEGLPPLYYSLKEKGFLFQRSDNENNVWVAISREDPFDISSYAIQALPDNAEVIKDNNEHDVFKGDISSLTFIPKHNELVSSDVANTDSKNSLMDTLISDESFWEFLDLDDQSDLLDALFWEGEYFFSKKEFGADEMSFFTFLDALGEYDIQSGKIYIHKNTLTETNFGDEISFKPMVIHEFKHLRDAESASRITFYDGNQFHDLIYPFLVEKDDIKLWKMLIGALIDASPSFKSWIKELIGIAKSKYTQNEDEAWPIIVHDLLAKALIESTAYLEESRYLFNSAKSDSEYFDLCLNNTISYLAISSGFLMFPNGEEAISEIVEMLRDDLELVAVMKSYVKEEVSQELAVVITPFLDTLWQEVEAG